MEMSSLQEEHFTTIQWYVIFLSFPQWTQWLLHTGIVKQMEEVFLLVRMGFAWKNRLFLQVDWLQKTGEGELWPVTASLRTQFALRTLTNMLINFSACQAQSQQSIDGQLLNNLLHNVSMTWASTPQGWL